MDKSLIIFVTLALLSYTATARSYRGFQEPGHQHHHQNGYYNHNQWFGMQSHWGSPHGHHHGYEHYPWQGQDSDSNESDNSNFWNDSSDNSWSSNSGSWFNPGQDGSFTTQNPRTPTPAASSGPSTLEIVQCMRSCPATSEYNPVCGTNMVTYNNPGRLQCAKNCGVDVDILRSVSCAALQSPNNTPNSATTSPPNTEFNPTRFTTIDINGVNTNGPQFSSEAPAQNGAANTIPPDVLASVFPPSPDDEDPAVIDFDVRIKDESQT